jgi:hypothetical protein
VAIRERGPEILDESLHGRETIQWRGMSSLGEKREVVTANDGVVMHRMGE